MHYTIDSSGAFDGSLPCTPLCKTDDVPENHSEQKNVINLSDQEENTGKKKPLSGAHRKLMLDVENPA